MQRSDVVIGAFALAFAASCAAVDPFAMNRESAIARARADTGCAEPMTADIVDGIDAGYAGVRGRKAEVVVAGCGKVARYESVCAKASYASGCQTNRIGEIKSSPTPEAAPAPAPAPSDAGTT